ncbi:MAG: ARMT1-like domain-containing protein [Chloroflexota bacterium]
MRFTARTISPGIALGQALVSSQGISFFGGVDPDTGTIVERGHVLEGQSIAGKVLVFPTGKGSTVGSYTLYRLKHNCCAPLAIVNAECETITAVGCIISEIPCIDQVPLDMLNSGQRLLVDAAAGVLEILPPHFTPPLPLPDPLIGLDGSFTEESFRKRLPGLLRRVAGESSLPGEYTRRLLALADEIPGAALTPVVDPNTPDLAPWQDYAAPLLGKTWLEAPWFAAELYLWRRVLAATGYFQPGPGQGVDPYRAQKQAGLAGTREAVAAWLPRLEPLYHTGAGYDAHAQAVFTRLLHAAVWGNQADQSVFPAGGAEQPDRPDAGDLTATLLVDDAAAVAAYLARACAPPAAAGANADRPAAGADASGAPVTVVLDNCGLELAYDLLVADFLLSLDLARPLVFEVKTYPIYVSDVTPQDVLEMLDYLAAGGPHLARFAARLSAALADGRWQVRAHPFWVSPLPCWEMPADLWAELHRSVLLISKGDANYRRWLGDRHWPFTTPFADITVYRPAPVLALRVLKSEIVSGLRPGQPAALDEKDPTWLYNGRWGLIQFSN